MTGNKINFPYTRHVGATIFCTTVEFGDKVRHVHMRAFSVLLAMAKVAKCGFKCGFTGLVPVTIFLSRMFSPAPIL